MSWTTCVVLLAFAAVSLAQTYTPCTSTYTDECLSDEAALSFQNITDGVRYITDYEWIGYDGWYNNPAHPEWGGAGRFMQA